MVPLAGAAGGRLKGRGSPWMLELCRTADVGVTDPQHCSRVPGGWRCGGEAWLRGGEEVEKQTCSG